MRIFFHDYAIESHRSSKRVAELILALDRAGIEATHRLDTSCAVAFCGTFEDAGGFLTAVNREDVYRAERGLARVRTCYFNWDLYPWKMDGPDPRWQWYARELSRADRILVPSMPVVRRTQEYCKRESHVILSSCNAFEPDGPVPVGTHVLDVMRPYDGDKNTGLVKSVCDELGIPCVESRGRLSPKEFREAVVNARVLASVYDEASTGGLTLLEGYRIGKPVVITISPRNGAWEYFLHDKGWVFPIHHEKARENLKKTLREIWTNPKMVPDALDASFMRDYVDARYSDDAFALRLAEQFRALADEPLRSA